MKKDRQHRKIQAGKLRQKIVVPATAKYLSGVRTIVYKLWRKQGLPQKDGRLVALAVDEALSAIINHARGMKQPGNINIELHLDDVCFKALIQDNTRSFLFDCLTEQDKQKILEREKQYQLGVFLISAIMDEISYRYHKGFQNELQLIRFINRS